MLTKAQRDWFANDYAYASDEEMSGSSDYEAGSFSDSGSHSPSTESILASLASGSPMEQELLSSESAPTSVYDSEEETSAADQLAAGFEQRRRRGRGSYHRFQQNLMEGLSMEEAFEEAIRDL